MTVTPLAAANAYALQAKEIADAARPAGAGATPKGDFASLLEDTASSIIQTGKAADTQMQLQATSGTNVIDVVTAVAEAELTVQTIVSVRDRVLGAYQEIMRMPI
jgi:flagellar hook-basal body complex protein FliE